jgi:succinate dehydrogenase flavin-adding protein (antitoxin of CptAB toxin-antitoxin module)
MAVMNIEDMRYELEDFFEAAGFSDFYERVLKNMTDEQIIASYNEIFSAEDPELEKWERMMNDEKI